MTFKEKLEELVDLFPTFVTYSKFPYKESEERRILAEKVFNFWLFEQYKVKCKVEFKLKDIRYKNKIKISSRSKKIMGILLRLVVKNNIKMHQFGQSCMIIELSDFDYTLN